MLKMVIKDDCKICESNKARLAEANLLEKVELVHISTDEGVMLAKKYGLRMAGSDLINVDDGTKMTVDEFLASAQ